VVRKEDDDDDNDNLHYNNNTNKSVEDRKESTAAKSKKSSLLERRSALEEKVRVAITSIVASASLMVLKFVIGFSTNSLGILSESMHSGLDFIAALMTFSAIRIVMRPPDSRYTYGYAKFESIVSLAEIILLFAVAGWVFYEGIERILLFKYIQPEITVFSFVIMLVSIGVDFGRSRALYKTARKFGSQALEADALHFKTDMFSSAIVVVGLFLVLIFNIPNADSYAAIIVAGMIIYTSLGLGRRTLDVLLDKAPKGVYHQVLETVSGLEGVSRPHDIRIRKMGSENYVDMHIEVPRTFTHDRAHRVATAVEEKVRHVLPNSNVLVHVDATEFASETITDRIRLIAAETDGIRNVHSIYMSKIPSSSLSPDTSSSESLIESTADEKREREREKIFTNSNNNNNNLSAKREENKKKNHLPQQLLPPPPLHLYLDVQMNSYLDLNSAHNIIESFEKRLKNEIPQIRNVTTHIEIEATEDVLIIGTEKKSSQSYIEKIRKTALSVDRVADCKDIAAVDVNGEQHITLIINIKAEMGKTSTTLEDAHRIATYVQNLIIQKTGASRVIVHTEPDLA
jgi:cation diffusion facilitator family transporter